MGRGDLTDEQWAVLDPLLPKGARLRRPPFRPRRRLIDGIRFRVRTGVSWRDVPVDHGPWGRIYDLFRRWQRNGTWHRILTRLQTRADVKGAIVRDLSVDSTVCRAQQHAAGAPQAGRPAEGTTERCIHRTRRSRAGTLARRVHHQAPPGHRAGSETHSIVVTAGQRGDSPQFEPRAPRGGGSAARPPRSGAGRQGVRLTQEPDLPAQTWDPLHHPGQGRPRPPP
ncbi:IS5 family transposase [Streptomyces sp. NPDC001651]|uniref:IS5 family transposase n=1 Tax=Streptomyces sp. NPDC001651 TaxID=3364596 RepID=UPI0036C4FE59